MSRYARITLGLAMGAALAVAGSSHAAPKGAAALDTNGDGRVTLSEFQTGRAGQVMAQLDTNKDGTLSKDEFAAMHRAAGHEGQGPDGKGPDAKGPGGKGPGGKGGDRMWSRVDLNNDGVLSPSELNGFLARRFAHMDTNNDGGLTPDELKRGPGKAKVGV